MADDEVIGGPRPADDGQLLCTRDGDWVIFTRASTGLEILRVLMPEGGATMAEIESFVRHLKQFVKTPEN